MNDLIKLVDAHRNHWSSSDDEGQKLRSQLVHGEDVFSRHNWNGHVTASALVINSQNNQVLFISSLKFNRYLLPGGHIDPGESIYDASLRELREETGLADVSPIPIASGLMLPLEINTHNIAENIKKSEPSHVHHDFVYGFLTTYDHVSHLLPNEEAAAISWLDLTALASAYPKSQDRLVRILGGVR